MTQLSTFSDMAELHSSIYLHFCSHPRAGMRFSFSSFSTLPGSTFKGSLLQFAQPSMGFHLNTYSSRFSIQGTCSSAIHWSGLSFPPTIGSLTMFQYNVEWFCLFLSHHPGFQRVLIANASIHSTLKKPCRFSDHFVEYLHSVHFGDPELPVSSQFNSI